MKMAENSSMKFNQGLPRFHGPALSPCSWGSLQRSALCHSCSWQTGWPPWWLNPGSFSPRFPEKKTYETSIQQIWFGNWFGLSEGFGCWCFWLIRYRLVCGPDPAPQHPAAQVRLRHPCRCPHHPHTWCRTLKRNGDLTSVAVLVPGLKAGWKLQNAHQLLQCHLARSTLSLLIQTAG